MTKDLAGVVSIGPSNIKVKISGGVIVVMNTVQVTFKGVDFRLYSLSKADVPPLTNVSRVFRIWPIFIKIILKTKIVF